MNRTLLTPNINRDKLQGRKIISKGGSPRKVSPLRDSPLLGK